LETIRSAVDPAAWDPNAIPENVDRTLTGFWYISDVDNLFGNIITFEYSNNSTIGPRTIIYVDKPTQRFAKTENLRVHLIYCVIKFIFIGEKQ
jgi:hypothetical protein